MTVYYVNGPLQSKFIKVASYIGKTVFQMHFAITVMLEITFLQRISTVRDLITYIKSILMRPFKIKADGDGKQLMISCLAYKLFTSNSCYIP